ncbi:FAD-dependent oxidoreductase [Herbaspirillum lusitanum]|uniref:FAD-dependent monooxygenase n=1 Tax=Herbaspirillum lusitanum TaxID=213312 RepID=UPI0022377B52|nr:FAD-dependent monooxygenase [Herbaspirillum lusitanum]MCW5299776.1 FAD-dependent oxidoreductase [Herbaspirillum lusitanum]
MAQHEVLIVGAGPTGMVLALWLNKFGVRVRILDKAAAPGTASRALVMQARTLELYRQLDLADAVLAEGHRAQAFNLWAEGEHKAHVQLGAIGEDLTPYPFLQILPQDRHEKLLAERLQVAGIVIERGIDFIDYSDAGSHVSARYLDAGGRAQTCDALYIVGCDGAHSMVRKSLGADFSGGTYRQLFYVADIEGSGPALNGEVHVDLSEADFVAVFGMNDGGSARLVGTIREDRVNRNGQADALNFEDVSERALREMKIKVDKVNWFSSYHVHHRVADRFRAGRAFIAGDAGHVHSPVGGQGMNTGIGDAINLAWKLAAVLRGEAGDSLLDSYEAERLTFARRLVQTTDRAFTLATSPGNLAKVLRTRIAPALLPRAVRLPMAREFLFRTVSQTTISYRHGPLGAGRAGSVHGGDRLPWAPTHGGDNFASLATPAWQVHVYGQARGELSEWAATRGIPLHVFDWAAQHDHAGLARDAAYLLRPDAYVACADPAGGEQVFTSYLLQHGLHIGGNGGDSRMTATPPTPAADR